MQLNPLPFGKRNSGRTDTWSRLETHFSLVTRSLRTKHDGTKTERQSQSVLLDVQVTTSTSTSTSTSPKLLLVIPHSMMKHTLELCHYLPLSGHMGKINTVIKVKQHVLLYGMARDCKLFVKCCTICNKNKKSTKHHRAILGQYHAGVPIERMHVDILCSLPVTRQKNKYFLMVIDQFIKWLECYPVPNKLQKL
jgi:hypothetical protein